MITQSDNTGRPAVKQKLRIANWQNYNNAFIKRDLSLSSLMTQRFSPDMSQPLSLTAERPYAILTLPLPPCS
ncbi:hypothetical protein NUF60_002463 [Yersinia enterocolitica]|uniref:hypothetical protein n=1 Tax=Yersinia enterocolitica TaxID=630 RepID=UPI0029125C38|nr:hypothetical protein [Yersinia enterocolitica]HDL6998826.1 hypothetical protein [Yersinia enterocolitica]HDL7115136.1 hypothetical protein [Yersinia enterocolitica]HEB2011356.1 hypothetical protein [Yersinia enterocolitica]